jgi:cell division protein FtsI (penicillin-binding protein 3)
VLWENQPHVVRRVISENTARVLTSILKGVVDEGGTGVMASVEGFEVAGKTGTAQKPDPARGGYSRKRIGSFIGFVPADEPRLVMLVIVDEPEGSVYGGTVAAPAFRNIAAVSLQRLAVVPDKAQAQSLPALQPASATRVERKVDRAMARDDGGPEVPDFIGLSLREAVGKARTLRIKVEMRGNGYVVKQSPAAGGGWGKDDVLTLNLQG